MILNNDLVICSWRTEGFDNMKSAIATLKNIEPIKLI